MATYNRYRELVKLGVMLSLPGTIFTCLYVINSILVIPGSILLGIGSLMLIIATDHDLKRKFPGHNVKKLNKRVRFDCKLLSIVWLLVGTPLSCTGFVQYSRHPLEITGCSIISLAVAVLMAGLISAYYLEFKEITIGTSQPTNTTTAGGINGSTIPIPTVSANISRHPTGTTSSVASEESKTYTQLLSDLQVLGTLLFIPGVCFSCIGWIRYYDRIVAGMLGAILLSIGGMLILISAFKVFRNTSEISKKRSAISKITLMFFVSGVPLTAVGFTHLQPGLALGIAGACLSGLSLISFIALRCCYAQEQTERTTGDTVTVREQNRNESDNPRETNNPIAYGPHLGGYPAHTGSEIPNHAAFDMSAFGTYFGGGYSTYNGSQIPNSTLHGIYSYLAGNQIYPGATGSNPAYPPTNYGPSAEGPAQSAPTTAQSADNDLPSYNQSKNQPLPSFQASDIPSAPPIASSNTDQVDNANIPPFQPVNEEDLPPPPSYDEVVKSGSNDSIIA